MKNVLLDRRTHVVAWATVVVLVWPFFVVPGGAAWPGIIWTAALAGPLVVTAIALVGRGLSQSRTQIVPSVEATPKVIADATRLRHCATGNARAVSTQCAEQRKEG
jgi:hypothetical protein